MPQRNMEFDPLADIVIRLKPNRNDLLDRLAAINEAAAELSRMARGLMDDIKIDKDH